MQSLHALNELISAGNVWDSAVNEAIVLIENEERRYDTDSKGDSYG